MLLMSGNERRLMRVQIAMAAVMVLVSAVLVPLWGGRRGGSGCDHQYRHEPSKPDGSAKVLGISPYNRGYLRLFLPAVVALLRLSL